MKPVALQLYSLRSDVYAAGSDLLGVLRTVADIGYKGVEMAKLGGLDPREIAGIASDLGLTITSTHTALPTPENINEVVDTHAALGTTRVVSGFGPDNFKTVDAVRVAASKFSRAAALLKPHGMTFGFHNHWWEFSKIEDKYVYDVLLEEAPDVFSELDTYWCAFAGADPAEIVSRHKSRLPLLHLKDGMLDQGDRGHLAVGSGKMDIPSVVSAADPSVLDWLIVEIDSCPTGMLEAVKQSYSYLTSSGLASGTKGI
ncbi:MAG: hypothetical protein A2Z18_04345 [Armatimonadetes bacterium RBG_16_58_9]|nr:MAG: hypothetical protein A2Z18_04345 [Armatimonadetes bacterium RBG_16_58_9]